MKKIICDYCSKESDNMAEYILPDYDTYEAKDSKGKIVCKFASNNIHSTIKDVCPDCAKKIIALLQLVPIVNFEEDNLANIKLYCYSKPNTMDGYLQNEDCHRYTDDVALCYANNIEQATDVFSRLYNKSLLENNVREVKFNSSGIFIATDY